MGVLLFKGGVGVGMLRWQTSGFPLQAGGTEPLRDSLREAGGTYGGGAIHELSLLPARRVGRQTAKQPIVCRE